MTAGRLWTGFAFILAGVLFLLNTLGILTWTIWWRLLEFWPVLLISIGVTMIFGRSKLAFLGPLLLAGAIAFAALAPGTVPRGWRDYAEETTSQVLEEGVESARFDLDLGAGQVRIRPGSDLAKADFEFTGVEPKMTYRRSGSTAVVEVSDRATGRKIEFFGFHPTYRLNADFSLNSTIPWDMTMEFGAVDFGADLSAVPVRNLSVDVGAGKLDLILGDTGQKGYIQIDSGVAKVYIQVPPSVGLRVFVEGGLTSKNLGLAELTKRGDYWESPNLESAKTSYEIRLTNGVGKVDIVRSGSDKIL